MVVAQRCGVLLPFRFRAQMNATKHHRERDAAPVPTDIAEKMIALKRKQAKYVPRRAHTPPPQTLFLNPSHTFYYFTAIIERIVQSVPLCPPRTPNLHRPAGNPLQGRHLRSSYLGPSQTPMSSLAL